MLVVNCASVEQAFKLAFEKYEKHTTPYRNRPDKYLIKKGRLSNQKDKIVGFEVKKESVKDAWCCFRLDFDEKKKCHINFSTMQEKFAFLIPSHDDYSINMIDQLTLKFSDHENAVELIKYLKSFIG